MSPPKLTHQEFDRSIWRAVVPPLLLLTAHALLLSLFRLYWLRTSERAERSEQVLAAVDDLERLLVNMETGVRGYLLTRDDEFLEPYVKSRARVDLAFKKIGGLLTDDRPQLERLNQTEQYFRAWVGEGPKGIADAASAPPPKGAEVLREQKSLMDRIRAEIEQMNRVEAERRDDRTSRESHAVATGIVGAIGVSVSLAIALALINRRTVQTLSGAYRQAIEEETESSRQFIDLAEAVPQFIWIADGAGRHTYFNSPWTDFTGRDSQSLRATGWIDSLHDEDRPAATERWREAMATGKAFEGEYRFRRNCDGAYRWMLCRSVPVMDGNGKVVKWFGSCTDIEEQKQAAVHREGILDAERQARHDLTRSARIKDEFLSILSHELRTPMTAILGWTRLLKDPGFRQKSLDRGIDVIENNARVQARLIDELLDLNRIRAGKLTLNLEPVDLGETVRAVVDSLSPTASGRQINLVAEIEPGLPTISGDKARLQQVAWNLIDNAMRFSEAGGIIRVNAVKRGFRVQLTVADTGRGISKEFLPYVFERFRQGDGSTTRAHGGLGMGLAIVKSLVEMHGGEVVASSEGEGRGATFTVQFPIKDNPSQRVVATPAAPIVAEESTLRGKLIVVVDDDAESAFIVQSILEHVGATVETRHSAQDALQLLRERRFDLIISDIGMSGMDGYMLIRELRAGNGMNSKTPALALTAFARPEDRDAALQAGFSQHATKPLDGETLRAAAAQVIAASHRGVSDPHQGNHP